MPDGIYHVTSRGNGKQAIYLDDADRRIFLATLSHAVSRHGWHCLAYCLMDNHYHLLVETPRPNLPAGMRQLNGVYAQRFNRRHERCGHLFQARYSAVLVERDTHLLEAARYIALNPVAAGLCDRPEQWPWSSHRAVLGLDGDDVLSVGRLLSHFGGRVGRYREFVADGEPRAPDKPYRGVVAGTDGYRLAQLGGEPPSPEIPRTTWEEIRPALQDLLAGPDRDQAIVTAFRDHGYRMREIAEALGCHYATVSRRIKAWEARHEMLDCKT